MDTHKNARLTSKGRRRGLAPAALQRQANRRPARDLARDREPHPLSAGSQRRSLPRRLAKIMSDEKKRSAVAFLKAALAYYASLGIKVERVMTDNGSCYRSFAFRTACKRLGLRHICTKPPRHAQVDSPQERTQARPLASARHDEERSDREAIPVAYYENRYLPLPGREREQRRVHGDIGLAAR
jgi:hypothetical protein